jgi:hypothetical protein
MFTNYKVLNSIVAVCSSEFDRALLIDNDMQAHALLKAMYEVLGVLQTVQTGYRLSRVSLLLSLGSP